MAKATKKQALGRGLSALLQESPNIILHQIKMQTNLLEVLLK